MKTRRKPKETSDVKTLKYLAVLAVLATPAFAGQVNFAAVLTDQDGKPIKDADQRVLTLGRASMMALMQSYPDDIAASTEEKARRGVLALRVYTAGSVDVPAEDVVLIKKYIGKLYPPLIVVRALPLLEGKDTAAGGQKPK